ncbi:phosphatidylinositol phosphate synthase [Actinomadura rupiterrae]|uniref:phosphatidylinositol phosphate synthase n=1 Tax=Actinomadura rupiterrae TaxID=559627 RepID=UPI0020A36FAD|nr:CDP-alcohol phosphatidyltransferase family protein [Actinomadura rupiterrae]MCP2340874.1 CDP-diacylglycerol--glycerol-3-phosphate 3-phosphatidyltransferase [Actinomadura rupiterrae]
MLNKLRPALGRVLTPIGRGVARTGVTPNAITVVGTAGTVAGALVLFTRGHYFWGTMVITAFVLFDMLDGAVARVTGTTSRFGAFLDSTMDRVADAAIFAGLMIGLSRDGEDGLAAVALYCLVAGVVVSYAKARAEGLGYTCNVGIAERSERLIIALVAAGFHGLGVPYILTFALWLLAVLSTVTVGQRFATVYKQANALPPGVQDAPRPAEPRGGRPEPAAPAQERAQGPETVAEVAEVDEERHAPGRRA